MALRLMGGPPQRRRRLDHSDDVEPPSHDGMDNLPVVIVVIKDRHRTALLLALDRKEESEKQND
jgi:hypothetical protein